MRHYYILNTNPNFIHVIKFIKSHALRCELHINRTRFWVPEGPVLTGFLLNFSECAYQVDPTLDLVTGLPIQQ